MKIRYGFVSNSSSSSFICDVCGEEQSGMDMSISEAEMVQCSHGHTICYSHIKKDYDVVKEEEEAKLPDDEYDLDNFDCEFSSEHCPVCQMEQFTTRDIYNYFRVKLALDKKDMEAEIRKEFNGDYKKFNEFLKTKLPPLGHKETVEAFKGIEK